MSNKEKNDELLTLIKIVDNDFKKSTVGYLLSLEIGGPLLLILAVYILFLFYVGSAPLSDTFSSGSIIALVIASFALIISTFNFVDNRIGRSIVNQKYYFIIHKYHEKKTRLQKSIMWVEWIIGFEEANQVFENNSLLKGLLLIKSKNPEISLEKEYLKANSQLTEKAIIENLLYH